MGNGISMTGCDEGETWYDEFNYLEYSKAPVNYAASNVLEDDLRLTVVRLTRDSRIQRRGPGFDGRPGASREERKFDIGPWSNGLKRRHATMNKPFGNYCYENQHSDFCLLLSLATVNLSLGSGRAAE